MLISRKSDGRSWWRCGPPAKGVRGLLKVMDISHWDCP